MDQQAESANQGGMSATRWKAKNEGHLSVSLGYFSLH
jgi:hypothetical protein